MTEIQKNGSPEPKEQEGNRGDDGKFLQGHSIGLDTRYKPGESGNLNGRRSAYTDLIRDFSFIKVGEMERRQKIIGKLFELAEAGNLKAIEFIVERLEGKALERQERTISTAPIQVLSIDD
tara:strand:+ start:20 stop:382 length:363 start_codon:yes stop_codon:yes gene_type:complete